jgi:hypothetical protein
MEKPLSAISFLSASAGDISVEIEFNRSVSELVGRELARQVN